MWSASWICWPAVSLFDWKMIELYYCSLHFIFHYPIVTPIYYNSFYFSSIPNVNPNILYIQDPKHRPSNQKSCSYQTTWTTTTSAQVPNSQLLVHGPVGGSHRWNFTEKSCSPYSRGIQLGKMSTVHGLSCSKNAEGFRVEGLSPKPYT